MNRLTSLIVRKFPGPPLEARGRWENLPEEAEKDPLADLKLFATGWVGGLVFFGTLLA